jgi:hypothetical protein
MASIAGHEGEDGMKNTSQGPAQAGPCVVACAISGCVFVNARNRIMTPWKDQLVWGNRTVASINVKLITKSAGAAGLSQRAADQGRAASQWVKPKVERKRGHARQPSRTTTVGTSFPLNSKVQTR